MKILKKLPSRILTEDFPEKFTRDLSKYFPEIFFLGTAEAILLFILMNSQENFGIHSRTSQKTSSKNASSIL